MTARWLMRNGYMTYLSCVVESRKKKEDRIKGYTCSERISWCVFKRVIWITKKKKIEVFIVPIVQPPYRMVLAGLVELKVQLQELLDKCFIRSSVST
jgi:uncharacterized protein YjhX (UPF0386 family)